MIISGFLSISNQPKESSDSSNYIDQKTWKSKINSEFSGRSLEDLQNYCGASISNDDLAFAEKSKSKFWSQKVTDHSPTSNRKLTNLPISLDLRQIYPKCWSIGFIRTQGKCGSCWAIAALTSISDRYCIHHYNNDTLNQRLFSYQDALECCPSWVCGTSSDPCKGGKMIGGFLFAYLIGASTGENYGNFTSCKPYFYNPTWTDYIQSPSCKTSCANTTLYTHNYPIDKMTINDYKLLMGQTIKETVFNVMEALFTRGPILGFMKVYEDFYNYSSGVYQYVSGKFVGGHGVKIIGYGTLNGVDYWLVANSWGSSFGENGFFKIERGVNMVEIESFLVEGLF